LTVVDSSGLPVPRTKAGAELAEIQEDPSKLTFSSPGIDFDLLPGKSYTGKLSLRKYFQIEDVQDYTVRLKRWRPSMWIVRGQNARIPMSELSYSLKGKGHPSR